MARDIGGRLQRATVPATHPETPGASGCEPLGGRPGTESFRSLLSQTQARPCGGTRGRDAEGRDADLGPCSRGGRQVWLHVGRTQLSRSRRGARASRGIPTVTTQRFLFSGDGQNLSPAGVQTPTRWSGSLPTTALCRRQPAMRRRPFRPGPDRQSPSRPVSSRRGSSRTRVVEGEGGALRINSWPPERVHLHISEVPRALRWNCASPSLCWNVPAPAPSSSAS